MTQTAEELIKELKSKIIEDKWLCVGLRRTNESIKTENIYLQEKIDSISTSLFRERDQKMEWIERSDINLLFFIVSVLVNLVLIGFTVYNF